jgi:hypothetical protein
MAEDAPNAEETDEGIGVFFEPPYWRPEHVEAELPSGDRVPSEMQFDGRRLGFPRRFPAGTWILYKGVRTWGPVGADR